MRRVFFILNFSLSFCLTGQAQQIAARFNIDSLKKIMPSLKDSNRIDCLNKLSIEYFINALAETYINVHTDTAAMYASQAYNEAVKIQYIKGIADALQNLGEIARDRGNYVAGENYFRQSIELYAKINDREKYSWAHYTMGWCLHRQCRFSEAKLIWEKALIYYIEVDNKKRQSELIRMISYTYSEQGYNEKAFENLLQAIRITFKINDARGIISSPQVMGNLYKDAGEIETALAYYQLAANNAKPSNPVRYNHLLGQISMLMNQFDSAIYYYKKAGQYVTLATTDSIIIKRALSFQSLSVGAVYLKQHKYKTAIEQFIQPLHFFERGNDKNAMMRVLVSLAGCYQLQGNLTEAFLYAKRLFKIAQQTGARPFLRDAYKLYWEIYDRMGRTDSAYKYNLKYIALKDSILSDEYRRNIALSRMKSQDEQQKTKISLLQKDQQLSLQKLTLQQQKLKSESLIKYIFITAAGAFVLIAIAVFRNTNLKRKNEKQQLEHQLEFQQLESKKNIIEFQQQATELEMQALRAQMNPHFIFNCLSSINRFILINKTEEASDYLTKFSRLIRMALINSEKSLITLEIELEALRLYLDLERLRFKNTFNYSITFINNIDTNTVYIPPMLIQPFAENAIWHGLMHKKGIGQLEIQLCAQDKTLTCSIIDNGIGRNMAANFNRRSAEKNKSMGVEITAGRLALLNKSKNKATVFSIEDIIDDEGAGCGTKVTLTMPYKELTEFVA